MEGRPPRRPFRGRGRARPSSKIVAAVFAFATIPNVSSAYFDFSWTAPSQVTSGSGYSVSVDTYFDPDDPDNDYSFDATLYRGSSAEVDWKSGSAYDTVTLSGSFTDSSVQTVQYRAEAYSYYGESDISYHSVNITAPANQPPSPSISVDQYGAGASVTRPSGGSVSVTVRYSATDSDGNLSGIRYNIWNATTGAFDNGGGGFVSQSGSSGEVVQSVSLDSDGDWYFWTDAEDSAGAYASTGDWGGGYHLQVSSPSTTPTTFSFGNLSHTYDGSSKTATVTPIPAGATINHSLTRGPGANTYTVTADAYGAYSGSGSATLVISPATASFSLSSTSFTYNGSAQGPSVVVSPSAASGSVSTGGTLSATNVGTYTATASASGNYTGSNNSLTWSIVAADPIDQATVSISPSVAYVGENTSRSFTASGGSGAGGFRWKQGSGSWFSGGATESFPFGSPGAQFIYVKRDGDGTYNESNEASAYVEIDKLPEITSQSGNRSRSIGQSSPFSVNSWNARSYQWFKNGVAISGATSSTYTISSVQMSDAGDYTAEVSNAAGTVTTTPATLTVVERFDPYVGFPLVAPIQAQLNEEILVGGSVFDQDGDLETATVKWDGSVKQTWTDLNESPAERYTLLYVTGFADQYSTASMEVTDSAHTGGALGFGQRSQQVMVLGPNETPETTAASVEVISASEINLTGEATDSDGNLEFFLFYVSYPPNYNGWSLAGSVEISEPLATATATLEWHPASPLGDGVYHVMVKAQDENGAIDDTGAFTYFTVGSSATPVVAINFSPVPIGNDVVVTYTYAPSSGSAVGLYKTTDADNAPRAQVTVPNAGDGTVSFSSTGLEVGQLYHVRLFSGAAGASTKLATSSSFEVTQGHTLTVENGTGGGTGLPSNSLYPRTITANEPAPGEVFAGWIHVSGPGYLGNPAEPQTTFTIYGGSAHVKALFGAPSGPSITAHPQSLVRTKYMSALFEVVAVGAPPPTFQWKRNGQPIDGATRPKFVLNSVSSADAGTYTVVVTNAHGSTESNPATLTVEEPAATWAAIGVSPTWSPVTPASTTVIWSTSNATSVLVSGTGITAQNSTLPSGSQTVTGLALGSHTYTVTAQGPGGTVIRTATFNVTAMPAPGGSGSQTLVGSLPGEFSVDNKGAANYTIPLEIAPGRGGLQPALALSYNSQQGNGVAGTGGALSTGFPQAITRGRTILARDGTVDGVDFDEDGPTNQGDRLYLDGKRLLLTGGSGYWDTNATYRTEVDSFVSVQASGSAGTIESFTLVDKAGTTLYFGKHGTSTDGYQMLGGETAGKAYAWALKRVQDTVSNYIDFEYTHVGNGEHLLSSIRYTGTASAEPAFSVALQYESAIRPDASHTFVGGRVLDATRRLEAVILRNALEEELRRYRLSYEIGPDSGRSRLESVVRTDGTGAAQTSLLPTSFVWQDPDAGARFGPDTFHGPSVQGEDVSLHHYQTSGPLVHGDFNGDGKTDAAISIHGNDNVQGTRIKVFLGSEQGYKEQTGYWAEDAGIRAVLMNPADVNGDGRADLLLVRYDEVAEDLVVYTALSTGTAFGQPTPHSLAMQAPFNENIMEDRPVQILQSRVTTGDYNGDGRADILVNHYGAFVALRTDSGFGLLEKWADMPDRLDGYYEDIFDGFHLVERNYVEHSSEVGPRVSDFNGDGVDDVVVTSFAVELPPTAPDDSIHAERYIRVLIADPKSKTFKVSVLSGAVLSRDFGANSEALPAVRFADVILNSVLGDYNGDGLTDIMLLKGELETLSNGKQGKVLHWNLYLSTGSVSGYSYELHPDAMPAHATIAGQSVPTFYSPYEDSGSAAVAHEYWTGSQFFYEEVLENYIWGNNDQVYWDVHGTFAYDVNDDGRADFVWRRDKKFWYSPSHGTGFGAPQPLFTDPTALAKIDQIYGVNLNGPDDSDSIALQPVDVNGDGAADLSLHMSGINDAQVLALTVLRNGPKADLLTGVVDGMGRTTEIFYKPSTDASLYTQGAIDDPSTPAVEGVQYPIRELMNPGTSVVAHVYKDSGSDTLTERAHFSYQYSGNRIDLSGRGALGFHAFVTLDEQTHLFKYQFLAQSFPMTGLTAREQTFRYWELGSEPSVTTNFRTISSHDNTVVFDLVAGGNGTLWPFISQAVESRWEDGATAHFSFSKSNQLGGPESKPQSLFPAYGTNQPTGAHITITAESTFENQSGPQLDLATVTGYSASDTNGSGENRPAGTLDAAARFSGLHGNITYGNLKKLETDFGDGFTETVVTTYEPGVTLNGALTLTGRVDTVTTSVTSPGFGTETAPVRKYDYKPGTPLVTREEIDANAAGVTNPDPKLSTITTYDRDNPRGLITGSSISGTDLQSVDQGPVSYAIYSATEFDDRFDLPTITKNTAPYLHTTTTAYHPIFGLPTSVTDVNGAEVTYTYDPLGRTIRVRDELKGLQTDTTYALDTSQPVSGPDNFNGVASGSGITGVTGLDLTSAYAVTTTATVQPSVTAYYDRLGRLIRTIKDGYNGQQIHTDTAYNSLGQMIAVSLPYTAGGTRYWTKTTYDALGRVAEVTAPNDTITSNSYAGRTTSVKVDAQSIDGGVNPLPQTTTTLVDAKGRTVKVWNPDPATGAASGTTSIEFRLDGFGRMRKTVLEETEDADHTITAEYDALGRQTELNDPDKGHWLYKNSALGQVVRQEDARGMVTLSTFDRLGRPLSRATTGDGSMESASFHYYDKAATATAYPELNLVDATSKGWIGAPQREEADTMDAPGFDAPGTVNLRYYDIKGRPEIELAKAGGQWFYTHNAYDDYSRLQHVRHYWRPPGFEAEDVSPYNWQDYGWSYTYDGTGALSKSYVTALTDTSNRVWWDQPVYDHLDRITSVRKGSGHTTVRSYRPEDGVITGINTGSGTIQDSIFGFDGLGNLRSRTGSGGSETFGYDNLNRLTSSSKQGATSYFDNGNIRRKPDVSGTQSPADFVYGGAQPHAVTEAWGYGMTYDANGNLLTRTKTGESSSLNWTGFDKPRWMARTVGADVKGSEFQYNANRSRVMQLEFEGMSGGVPSNYVRKRLYGVGPTVEANYNWEESGTPAWKLENVRVYVSAPDGTVGTREFKPNAAGGDTEKLYVYHHDHLGSIESITPFGSTTTTFASDPGGKPGRFSEDAWGQRRDPTDWLGVPVTTDDGGPDSLTPRGFTGHEMLDDLGLVHMNGRIYDPLLGRMLSADTVVQFPGSLQSYNRYSYVLNNPLTHTDPSGHVIPLAALAAWKLWAIATAGVSVAVIASTPEGRQAAANASNAVVSGVSHLLESRTDANAVQLPVAGDQGVLRNTQTSEMTTAATPLPNSTATPVPEVATPQEGFSTAAETAVQEGMTAADPSSTQNSTAHDVPAVEIPTHVDVTRTYQTYTKTDPITGEVYTGRTSGTGTAAENVASRDRNHHMTEQGFGPAVIDKSSRSKEAIRGREQILIEANGGAKSEEGTSGNAINGISPSNPRREEYFKKGGRLT